MPDKYCYLVAVLIYLVDTGMNVTTTIDVEIDFRITRATIPLLLDHIKDVMPKKDKDWALILKDPGMHMKIVSFSKYDEE